MKRDQREREQLEKNLRERDAASTRKVLDLILSLVSFFKLLIILELIS